MKIHSFLILFLASLTFFSCEDEESYAYRLKVHNRVLEEFIAREGINVLSAMPEKFGENDYFKTESGLYFNLVEAGDGDTVRTGDVVAVRYKQKRLYENAPLEEFWTVQDIAHPTEFQFNKSSDNAGWNEAIALMKRSGAHCKIIVPYDLGSSAAQSNLTAYFFELKIKFHH